MAVVTAVFVDQRMTVEEAVSAVGEGSSNPICELHKAPALCNDASFDILSINKPVMERNVQGNATDCAALKFAEVAKA